MDETILFPSPNWFQPSGIAVSTDEWIVYGGPTKSLCVLEPLPPENDTVIKGRQAYTANVVNRAHPDKIVCVDLCPEWPERRNVLTGSSDGAVKQWNFERTEKTLNIKSTHSHEMHSNEKEEVVGVGYCKDGYAVTIGNFGHIVKWDLNSNVAKSFNNVLKTFRPTTMACSPHLHMHVAIGTKQGVLFVLDLNGYPRIVYKVRGQDDEILKVSWCPQYEVAVRKALKEVKIKNSAATQRLENIRQEPETPEKLKQLDEKVKNSETTDKPILINENSEPVTDADKAQHDESGMGKTLPEDSFDESAIQDNESIVQEDDMFDIYKDHEADEFGHKKFQPIDVMVKVPTETVKDDYLADCLKLKDEILKRKAESDTSIGELVDAMDKTKLDTKPEEQASTSSTGKPTPSVEGRITKGEVESSVHIHKHLLATISKQGGVRVWSKSGKLVGSSAVYNGNMQNAGKGKGAGGGGRADKRGYVSTLVWATPDLLLLGDGNNHVLDCNPLKIDCKNKMQWKPMYTLHTRGMFAIAVNTPRVQEPSYRPDDVVVWSAAQDRSLVRYSVSSKQHVTHMTCGGYIYSVSPCPYDARR
ncbi:hypothetical protein O0L34_g18453 [Tuta absoluta]|nr:hypothetical protein O0L34_g18453 [Tuta absoluta]